jgi:hypothetical protein
MRKPLIVILVVLLLSLTVVIAWSIREVVRSAELIGPSIVRWTESSGSTLLANRFGAAKRGDAALSTGDAQEIQARSICHDFTPVTEP